MMVDLEGWYEVDGTMLGVGGSSCMTKGLIYNFGLWQ